MKYLHNLADYELHNLLLTQPYSNPYFISIVHDMNLTTNLYQERFYEIYYIILINLVLLIM